MDRVMIKLAADGGLYIDRAITASRSYRLKV